MLFNPFVLEGIVEQELDENVLAELSCQFVDRGDHHFLHGLDEVVELGAEVASVNDGPEALECIPLHSQLINAILDHFNERLDLVLREILIDSIISNELGNALEQRVGEVRVRGLRLLKELENSIEELLEKIVERRQAETNYLRYDGERRDNNRIVICFK